MRYVSLHSCVYVTGFEKKNSFHTYKTELGILAEMDCSLNTLSIPYNIMLCSKITGLVFVAAQLGPCVSLMGCFGAIG